MPAGAVFLSYASEDAAAAERIATALRNDGIDVGFDKNALRGGDAWDRMIHEWPSRRASSFSGAQRDIFLHRSGSTAEPVSSFSLLAVNGGPKW